MAKHNDVGRWGEQLAADYLVKQGYVIAQCNWRSGHYELDIIAYKDTHIVFVEVKTRSNDDDDPLDAIDKRKIHRLVRAALAYVEINDIHHEIQFDIIAINGNESDYTIEHIPDAIQPLLRTY